VHGFNTQNSDTANRNVDDRVMLHVLDSFDSPTVNLRASFDFMPFNSELRDL
jgi:hypothetical protein